MSKEREKAILGANTLKDFCEFWGDDVHARILLEILFKGIMHEEALFVFGKQEQTRNQACDDFAAGIGGNIETAGFEKIESASTLGNQDRADYP